MVQDDRAVIDRTGLQALVEALGARGYQVVGPTVSEDAIVYDEIYTVEDLPAGWANEQDGGTYRLRPRDDGALFGYAVGPHSWKKYLFPPRTLLWKAQRSADGFDVDVPMPDGRPYAFLGVRSCELAAIQVQDRVSSGPYRSHLCSSPPRRIYRRGQLLDSGQYLLLRVDGHRSEGGAGVRPRAHRGDRRQPLQ